MTTTATLNTQPTAQQTSAEDPCPPRSLRQLALRATAWTITATYSAHAIRLASNLILTRLLFPEAFGLMAVLLLVLQGLNLFSDIGIQQSLIQHPRGNERTFNDTAWTLQVVRGVVLWLVSCAIALTVAAAGNWLPADSVLADDRLPMLLPIAGLSLIAAGFNATKLIALRRKIALGYEAAFQLGQQIVHVVIMIVWAWLYPSIWALLGGTVISAFLGAFASHWLVPGANNRLKWDRQAARELITFGRFIFISTIFTFVAVSGQKVIIGALLPTDAFGIYSIALALSTVVLMVIERLNGSVLFPLYSELARRNDAAATSRNIRRVRIRLLAVSLPVMWLVAIFGQRAVNLLYDPRYHSAGPMLQLLAVSSLILMMSATIRPVILAHGDSRRHLSYTTISSVSLIVCMALGAHLAGIVGVFVGAIVADLIQHVILLHYVGRYGVRTWGLDLAVLALSALVIAAGWMTIGLSLHTL